MGEVEWVMGEKGEGSSRNMYKGQMGKAKEGSDQGWEVGMAEGENGELICMTHGHEVRWGNVGGKGQCKARGNKEEEKNGTIVTA